MYQKQLLQLVGALAIGLIMLTNSLYIVRPGEQVIVFQFREKKRVVQAPGLYTKVPFLQETMYFDKRVLPLEPAGQLVLLDEQKMLEVDAFGRWRIANPFLFFQSLRDENNATIRLNSLLNTAVRNVLGTYKVTDLLSEKREEIMTRIKDEMNSSSKRFGVEIVNVRIRRTDLPAETVQNVYDRMRSQRQREAAALRAEGQKIANETRAKAEAERTILLSVAERDAQKLYGEGDKESLRIMTDANSRDPQFFSFYRGLASYRTALNPANTTYVLSPDSEFFKVFRQGNK